jgi:hypothetical protein
MYVIKIEFVNSLYFQLWQLYCGQWNGVYKHLEIPIQFNFPYYITGRSGSSVGIETDYGLDDPGIE